MTDQPQFVICDEKTGVPLTPEQAERWLYAAVTDFDQAQEFLDTLDAIDRILVVLALVVTPGLRKSCGRC
jgi:hypothetical protein